MIRVGIGYDIHRTTSGTRVVLGGVEIDAEFGLDGHSDADVLLHAIMDALLGAAGLPDIGHHFPPGEDEFRGISSVLLLERVRDVLLERKWQPVNIDSVLVAERPRVELHTPAMRACIAAALHVSVDSVGVKATTNERVGPEGRMEAISAQAVALIESVL